MLTLKKFEEAYEKVIRAMREYSGNFDDEDEYYYNFFSRDPNKKIIKESLFEVSNYNIYSNSISPFRTISFISSPLDYFPIPSSLA